MCALLLAMCHDGGQCWGNIGRVTGYSFNGGITKMQKSSQLYAHPYPYLDLVKGDAVCSILTMTPN
jgi:hypothetical protein